MIEQSKQELTSPGLVEIQLTVVIPFAGNSKRVNSLIIILFVSGLSVRFKGEI